MKPGKWTTLESTRVFETPIFDLHRHRRSHHRRGDHNFFVLEAPDWINIIPLTPQNEVVMVRQYRHGIEGFTLEIPGGMVDPEDSDPRTAAIREMWEESGYESDDVLELGKVHPNPAIQANYCYSFLARNVRHSGKPEMGGSEETEVVVVPLDQIAQLIRSGGISHALVIAAFSFFHLYNPPPAAESEEQSCIG